MTWSSRERDHARQLDDDDTIARPSEPRGAKATLGYANAASRRMRDIEAQREPEPDAATPEQRAHNERAALIDFYADRHMEQKAADERERQEKECKRQQQIAAARAEQERAQKIGEQAVARANRAEILGIMRDDLNLIEEVTKEVGRHKGEPLYYPAALAAVKARRMQ